MMGAPDDIAEIGTVGHSAAQTILLAVARVFDVDHAVMTGRSRFRHVSRARQAAYYVLKQRLPHLSYPVIGRLLGGVDHSSVIYGYRQIEHRIAHDPDLAGKVFALLHDRVNAVAQDAHIQQWRAYREAQSKVLSLASAAGPDLGEELAEFVEPDRVWCGQCDASVSLGAAVSCKSRFCGVKVRQASSSAAAGRETASSSAAIGGTQNPERRAA
ncbi:hypothetical protein J3454_14295 [Erythrobacter sp. NFXS35]|uniref:helix-turn-helix domain-containing protein n=1 Tax=Erythrobacter sp. NFXS35 TaxID=2818436 RepID=UPI0032DFB869